jgi:hypothetical protein
MRITILQCHLKPEFHYGTNRRAGVLDIFPPWVAISIGIALLIVILYLVFSDWSTKRRNKNDNSEN